MNGIDCTGDWSSLGSRLIKEKGIGCVFRYLGANSSSFPTKVLSYHEVNRWHDAGVKVGVVFEKGFPTSAGYFSSEQGKLDAELALDQIHDLNAPAGVPVFFAVDYDASYHQTEGEIGCYFQAVHDAFNKTQYLVGVYGSGLVCDLLVGAGVAHYSWLAQSTGWDGYAHWQPKADVIQGREIPKFMGIDDFDVDLDTVVNLNVVW